MKKCVAGDVAECVVSPVVNTAPPQNIVLFLEHSHYKYNASRALKRNDRFFNKVGVFKTNGSQGRIGKMPTALTLKRRYLRIT